VAEPAARGEQAGADGGEPEAATVQVESATEDAHRAPADNGSRPAQATSAPADQLHAAGLASAHRPVTSAHQVREVHLPDLLAARGPALGGQRLRLEIDPPELGSCELELTLRGDQLRATVIAHRPDTAAAMRDAEPQVRQALAQRGIELAGYEVGGGSGQGGPQPDAVPRQWAAYQQAGAPVTPARIGDSVRLLGRSHAGQVDLVA